MIQTFFLGVSLKMFHKVIIVNFEMDVTFSVFCTCIWPFFSFSFTSFHTQQAEYQEMSIQAQ